MQVFVTLFNPDSSSSQSAVLMQEDNKNCFSSSSIFKCKLKKKQITQLVRVEKLTTQPSPQFTELSMNATVISDTFHSHRALQLSMAPVDHQMIATDGTF